MGRSLFMDKAGTRRSIVSTLLYFAVIWLVVYQIVCEYLNIAVSRRLVGD